VCQGDVDTKGGFRAGSVQALSSGFTIAGAMPPLKVFISYSNVNRSTAESLYRDLQAAGAEPFEFRESSMGDAAAFSEILSWISRSDAFVVLVSEGALDSTAVQEEVRHANHRYISSRRRHPAKIISAIIEPGAEPPEDIERLSQVEMLDYGEGLPKLFRLLRLEPPARLPAYQAPVLPEIDFDKLAREHAQSSPTPVAETDWFNKASALISNYNRLKPSDVELPKEEKAEHVDSLLAGISGQARSEFADPEHVESLDRAFLGVEPSEPMLLGDSLIAFNPSKRQVPLNAPLLEDDDETLQWTAVPGATGYILERFVPPVGYDEVYSGPERSYRIPRIERIYIGGMYRVKATGGVFRADSPWSDPVEINTTKPDSFFPQSPASPAPPSLDLNAIFSSLSWSAVDGATGYTLERTMRSHLLSTDNWKSVYEGDGTVYIDFDRSGELGTRYAYRVKAEGPWGETPWSDEVVG
jgi:TIR domain-containing protein